MTIHFGPDFRADPIPHTLHAIPFLPQESAMPAMIVAPQPLAVEEGAKMLQRGGNAYDAALVCAFTQFILDPHSCGVGGYLLLAHHPAGAERPQPILDAPALAGSR